MNSLRHIIWNFLTLIIQRVIPRNFWRGMKRLWKIMSAEPTLLIKNPPRYLAACCEVGFITKGLFAFTVPVTLGVPTGVSRFGEEEDDEEEEEKNGICANCGKYDCEC